jgi:pyrrolidone-carboxylate peptidase
LIILTGFGPYANYTSNITSKIVQCLKITDIPIEIKKTILPVKWNYSVKKYQETLNNFTSSPQFVILLGIHPSRHYSLESFAVNFAFGKDIDNNIKFRLIQYKSSLFLKNEFNLRRILKVLKTEIKIKQSYFPGFFLCNYIYYWALKISKKQYPVFFIHIPHKENLTNGLKVISKIIKYIALVYDLCV